MKRKKIKERGRKEEHKKQELKKNEHRKDEKKENQKEYVIKEKAPEEKAQKEKRKKINKFITLELSLSFLIALFSYFITKDLKISGIAFLITLVLVSIYLLIKKLLKKAERIRKMEEVFPDFIELMASNLRAGMTIDKALLLSSRKEFSPLDEEILILGKGIITGEEITSSLIEMAKRTKSEKILKTITIINSGIRSGGNLAILLEQTALSMRERGFVEKRAASNVLMYVIFIFFAVAIGAPILFSLSSVLVEVLTNILSDLPSIETSQANVPFTLTSVNISVDFITYFSIIFLILVNILASLLLGLVSKGEEKEGLKYAVPLIILSTAVFFIVRFFLLSYFSGIGG